MITTATPEAPQQHAQPHQEQQQQQRLIQYFSEAGPDYAAWSPEYHMHFGYFDWSMNPLRREPMLRRMNAEVLRRVRPMGPAGRPLRLLDLGCGVGATARAAARYFRNARVMGLTVVPWQVRQARAMTLASAPVTFLEADYQATGLPSASYDGAWAIESACYARGGADKADFAAEAFRLLKPGASLVVADGFLNHDDTPMPKPLGWVYRTMCDCWAIDEMAVIGRFARRLEAAGFTEVRVEDVSWRVAPSVAHVPFVSARFLWDTVVRRRQEMTHHRWNNLWAPLLLTVAGLARSRFGYYIVTARKPAAAA